VVDVTFTKELEAKMEDIERLSQTRGHVIMETVDYLKPIIAALKSNEREIGEELAATLSEIREESTTLLTPCPQCGSKLKIVRNPHTKKRFIGCAGKWKNQCNFTLPLPQLGTLTMLQKRCQSCGFQLVQVRSKGRRPMVSCCRCYATMPRASPSIPEATATPNHR
jgi:predicted RNA-binding Zn-ribbon protein involved in translation (DUF1610 family)